MKYKVDKQRCKGCEVCVKHCPGATMMGQDGKCTIVDEQKLEQCGGEKVCPYGAILNLEKETETIPPLQQQSFDRGMGRGMGKGRGRGLGIGPRDGRGKGRGGGGRRRY